MPTSTRALASTGSALGGRWQRLLHSRSAPLITHGSLVFLTAALFALLLGLPLWLAWVPCALIHHRIGVLLHEYIHGIPFARYRHNLWVLSFFDGLMLMFGLMDFFRGTHLEHHRWLNTDKDPAFTAKQQKLVGHGAGRWLGALEGTQHLVYMVESFGGKHPYVIRSRIVVGVVLSLTWIGFWVSVGQADVVWALFSLTAFNTLGPVSLRGALEHHSRRTIRPSPTSTVSSFRYSI